MLPVPSAKQASRPARPARPAQPAQLARPPRPGQNSCSLRLDFNSREYEDFKVIQGYEDLEILVSLPLVRLAGEMQLQSFRNRVVTEATMLTFEFLTRQDIHHPLKLTEGYLCLQLISLARSRRNKICLIAR